MKKLLAIILKTGFIIAMLVSGFGFIHFYFVLGVDSYHNRQLLKKCEAYAIAHNAKLIEAVNTFTYENNDNYAVCVVDDVFKKLVFLDPQNKLILYRNARSLQSIANFDPNDKSQSLLLSLYQDKPVYIYKKITKTQLTIAYYSFDQQQLLFELKNEE